MGYSCRADAAMVLDAIGELMSERGIKSSNGLPCGFWERGRENVDGSITGTVWKTVKRYTEAERIAKATEMSADGVTVRPEWVGDPCRRAGSFKIEAGGKIKRFPGLSAAERTEAEKRGTEKYRRLYGG